MNRSTITLVIVSSLVNVLAMPAIADSSSKSDSNCMLPSNLKARGFRCDSVGDFGGRGMYNPAREIQIIDERPVVRDYREAPVAPSPIVLPTPSTTQTRPIAPKKDTPTPKPAATTPSSQGTTPR